MYLPMKHGPMKLGMKHPPHLIYLGMKHAAGGGEVMAVHQVAVHQVAVHQGSSCFCSIKLVEALTSTLTVDVKSW